MADDTTLSVGAGGDVIHTLGTAAGPKWAVEAAAYATTLSAGANVLQVVTLTTGLPVQPQTGSTWSVDSELTTADLDTGAGTDTRAVIGLVYAASGGAVLVSAANPLPVTGTVAISGTVAVASVGGSVEITNDSGNPIPVSGTVAATQSGAWNITNISGTVSLPTGAATAAKQAALGTAGSASADVLTVQGVASMTALKVDGSAVTQPVSGTVTANAVQSGTWNVGTVTTVTTVSTVTAVTAITNALPTGANVIGKVTTDQTTHGTTDLVAADITKVAGASVATGHGTASGAMRVELPTDGTGQVSLKDINAGDYETVAASQTDQALGATGATGDYLAGVLIVPATTSPGAVSIKDGAGSAITVFTGGASSVSNLVPFFVPLGILSAAGAWKLTTGASVSAIGVGNFT
jgi:hypothetical protein